MVPVPIITSLDLKKRRKKKVITDTIYQIFDFMYKFAHLIWLV